MSSLQPLLAARAGVAWLPAVGAWLCAVDLRGERDMRAGVLLDVVLQYQQLSDVAEGHPHANAALVVVPVARIACQRIAHVCSRWNVIAVVRLCATKLDVAGPAILEDPSTLLHVLRHDATEECCCAAHRHGHEIHRWGSQRDVVRFVVVVVVVVVVRTSLLF